MIFKRNYITQYFVGNILDEMLNEKKTKLYYTLIAW